jgi:hypothetical protein
VLDDGIGFRGQSPTHRRSSSCGPRDKKSVPKRPRDQKCSPNKPHGRKSVAGHSRGRRSSAANKLLADFEVGTSSVPYDVESSFHRGYYSPLTTLDRLEWEVMYREFMASSLVVKSEPHSD